MADRHLGAKRDGTVVTTKYEWTANKSFIRCQFSITQEGQTTTGMQMIGKMPSTGGLHMWTFEDAGGSATRTSRGTGRSGFHGSRLDRRRRVLTATNIMTPIERGLVPLARRRANDGR